MEKIILNSALETKKFASQLAKKIIKERELPGKDYSSRGAFVVGLIGDLGSGKTTFTQGFAKGLHIREPILSPTFVIYRRYAVKDKNEGKSSKTIASSFKNFYHFDCYRLKNHEEILSLGFVDIVNEADNLIIIEWAEKIKKILPKNALILRFKLLGKDKREIKFG